MSIKEQNKTKNEQREKEVNKTSRYMFYILVVLRRFSSKDNPLTHQEIADRVRDTYGKYVKISRDTVSEHLSDLMSLLDDEDGRHLGYSIERISERGGVYLEIRNYFTDYERRLLIDNLAFSTCIPYEEYMTLANKLTVLPDENHRDEIKYVKPFQENREKPGEKKKDEDEDEDDPLRYCSEFVKCVETIRKAIKDNKQINFKLTVDGPGRKSETTDRKGISPYELVIYNSKYYMIGAYDTNNSYHFRVDFMHDVVIPTRLYGENGKPRANVRRRLNSVEDLKPGLRDGIDLVKYMREHIYMYSGLPERVTFLIDNDKMYHVYDWFGDSIDEKPYDKDPGKCKVTVKVVRKAMLFWLLQYGQCTEVVFPPQLRKDVLKAVEGMYEKYKTPLDERK